MKNYDSRTYSISDFLQWQNSEPPQLILNPKFQRRSVWTDTARSYLMDTIVRGLPIPKFFIRQQIIVTTRSAVREVVDGQQRLRTIFSYLEDGFQILKRHNADFGGKYFSQLDQDQQSNILNYELSVDLLTNMPDKSILDIFGRLNSYSVVLNEQEKLNASHFGSFKMVVDSVAHDYNSFWVNNKIFTEQQILRMLDSNLVAELFIAMIDGIKGKKALPKYYDRFEDDFSEDQQKLSDQFSRVLEIIQTVYPEGLKQSEFNRPPLFYTLFTSIFHEEFGLKDMDMPRKSIAHIAPQVRTKLERVELLFSPDQAGNIKKDELEFLNNTRNAGSDQNPRTNRTKFVLALLNTTK